MGENREWQGPNKADGGPPKKSPSRSDAHVGGNLLEKNPLAHDSSD
jgi:hypothetical protein